MHAVAEFLAAYPPFDRLDPEEREHVAAAVQVRSYSAGEDLLVEDGPPAQHFYVVREGSVELLHEDEPIDILEPGEGFGHPSLLTGLAPAFTVRAHEPSTCYLVPHDVALEVLSRPGGVEFVAATFRERLTRTGHTVHALPQLRTIRVGALVSRRPPEIDADVTIREVAAIMTREHATAALVHTPDALGIITDVDLREKVVAGSVPADAPVSAIVSLPLITTPADRFALEVVVDMLDAGIHHMPVLDDGGGVVGIISADELLELEARSPFAVRRALAHARDEDELAATAARLPGHFLTLLDTGLSPLEVGRVLALQSDTVTNRLLDFAFARHGPAPVAWAWMALGSVARRELTLASDQDSALAYADDAPEVDAYFERVTSDVTSGLARCGFGRDQADVLASNRLWRMSRSAWLRTFDECLERPDRSHLVRAAVSFDFRHVAGGLDVVQPLVERVRDARNHPDFLARLARTATDARPPLGFRHRIVPDQDGDQHVHIDIKRGGTLPIVNLARFHALANGVTISRTLDRLVAVEELGALDGDTARSLREAFEILWSARLGHHAERVRTGNVPDNLVNPDELPPLAKVELREALRAIQRAQKQLSRYVPLGL